MQVSRDGRETNVSDDGAMPLLPGQVIAPKRQRVTKPPAVLLLEKIYDANISLTRVHSMLLIKSFEVNDDTREALQQTIGLIKEIINIGQRREAR